jgi:tetratricopeptide (TPR) repeat protein
VAIHQTARRLFDEGVAAYVKNELRKSIQMFSAAIKQDSKFELAYVSRGAAYLKLKKAKKAVADFNRAIKLYPQYARAFHLRGLAYEKMGETARAYRDFDRALEIDPDYGPAYHSRNSLISEGSQEDFSLEELDIINHLMAMRVSHLDDNAESDELAA